MKICDMNCFQCKLNDCKYNGKMSEWEKEQYRRAHTETYDMPKEERELMYAKRRNAKRRKKASNT